MEKTWWKEAVGYQIYPRSFKDSNGDGVGDLNGIREKLPYLKAVGIDFIWINPVYESPNVDNGYDISHYQEILAEFGTMANFDQLLEDAHHMGIKVIMDLVINHTSDRHEWFKEAKKSKDSPFRDYYIWRDAEEGKPPSDWQAIFGGSVWEYDEESKQYYFHAFAKEQPDLNWENEQLKKEVFAMISWWLDKGIDGFRIDAISHIKKDAFHLPTDSENVAGRYQNITGIGEYLKELKQVFDRYDIMTVGEASGVTAEEAEDWAGHEGYFDMIFEFEHIGLWKKQKEAQFDIRAFKQALSRWQYALDGKGWNALYMENHDVCRSVSVFGSEVPVYRERSAKALAMMYLFLQGTPFIYQGQEIGMTNMHFSDIDEINALDSKHIYQELVDQGMDKAEALAIVSQTTRDNARTPMQWDDSVYGGFSETKPWLAVNPNTKEINVASQLTDATSVLSFYQQLIRLRKESQALIYGSFEELISDHEQIYAYLRTVVDETFLILVNLSGKAAEYQLTGSLGSKEAVWDLVVSNMEEPDEVSIETDTLAPFEARAYRTTGK
ncbi:glycoside hydrolase family 13 protein [Candidatus Enterococcus clewellii]|uniref:Alpha-glucosidase n=1 Tax=Candidatus Enterococcus clewellii TaxID=1834193 RepID=A0A242K6M4_9ENTE|nr:alpha-glucosidase [Enterococcus sp. 9E7_DIV0242]OTP15968.1 hypothetical protein A5888_002182 [Enterococcus sp. 9E7_DIV0242]